jgi:hypothetical protein
MHIQNSCTDSGTRFPDKNKPNSIDEKTTPFRSVFPFCLLKLPSENRSIVISSEGSDDPFSGILDIRLAQGDACQGLLQHFHKQEKVYQ